MKPKRDRLASWPEDAVNTPYDPQSIEEKWQAVWDAEGLHSVVEDPARPRAAPLPHSLRIVV